MSNTYGTGTSCTHLWSGAQPEELRGMRAVPLPGLQAEQPLSDSWHTFLLAMEDAFRSEAARVLELQLENEALKAGMRNFKKRAQDNAQKLRALTSTRSELLQLLQEKLLQRAWKPSVCLETFSGKA